MSRSDSPAEHAPAVGYPPDPSSAAMFHAARAGRFPQFFADQAIADGTAAALGVDRATLEQFGEEIFKALSTRCNHEKAKANLQKLARRRHTALRRSKNRAADEWFFLTVCAFQSDICERQHGRPASAKWAYAMGRAIAAHELLLRRGTEPTFEEVCRAAAHGSELSATDIQTAIRLYTHDAGLTFSDWLIPRNID